MPADQLYSLYIRKDIDHYVPELNCSAKCFLQLSWSLKKQWASLPLFSKPSHRQALHCDLWSPWRPVHNHMLWSTRKQEEELMPCVSLSVKQANESCESCHFSLHLRHESVPIWGRQKADSTGNQFLHQIIAIPSAERNSFLCVIVVFMIDDRLVLSSLDGLVSDDNPANEPYDLHNYGCESRPNVWESALWCNSECGVFLSVTQLHSNAKTWKLNV